VDRVPGRQLSDALKGAQQLRVFTGVWTARQGELDKESLSRWLGLDQGFHDMYALALEGDACEKLTGLEKVLPDFEVISSVVTPVGRLDVLVASRLKGAVKDLKTGKSSVEFGHAAFCFLKLGATSVGFSHVNLTGTLEQRGGAFCELFEECPCKAQAHWTAQQLVIFTKCFFVLGSLNFPLVSPEKEVSKWIEEKAQENLWASDELLQIMSRIGQRAEGHLGIAAAAANAPLGLPSALAMLLSFFNERVLRHSPSVNGWPQRILFKDTGATCPVKCLSYDVQKDVDNSPIFSQFDVDVNFPIETPPVPEEKPVPKKTKTSRFCTIQ
jgi:hypothetical protein